MQGKSMEVGKVNGYEVENISDSIALPVTDEIAEKLILQSIAFYESFVKLTARSSSRAIKYQ
ncbi:hypothetical protein BFS16_00510 [Hoylesella timonensis]|uniref:Uncharacterized protein n=1 Tax=Hoylesella timonensis TaxID=386414 RepID=A0A2K0XPD5_9BACT|nr:hypothetical protein BFS16_00510 [Hoylesella timonensis]